jgi:hypothetical protein
VPELLIAALLVNHEQAPTARGPQLPSGPPGRPSDSEGQLLVPEHEVDEEQRDDVRVLGRVLRVSAAPLPQPPARALGPTSRLYLSLSLSISLIHSALLVFAVYYFLVATNTVYFKIHQCFGRGSIPDPEILFITLASVSYHSFNSIHEGMPSVDREGPGRRTAAASGRGAPEAPC